MNPLRGSLTRQVRWRGSTHQHLNWHNQDVHTEAYHSLDTTSVYYHESQTLNHRKSDYKWDQPLSNDLYGKAVTIYEPKMSNPLPQHINEHLFARTYWNTNINLYYWKKFHLNFYYVERNQISRIQQVFSNRFVGTPRWAGNLVFLYTKNPWWNFIDIGLRRKTMMYVNNHIWLVFKFKMHKIARLNGLERGIISSAHKAPPLREVDNSNHYHHNDTARDHTQEGAGFELHRSYAHVATMAGPEFSKHHSKGRPWWWHAYPHKRKRWDASNPFGNDDLFGSVATNSIAMTDSTLDKSVMSNW